MLSGCHFTDLRLAMKFAYIVGAAIGFLFYYASFSTWPMWSILTIATFYLLSIIGIISTHLFNGTDEASRVSNVIFILVLGPIALLILSFTTAKNKKK